MTKPHHKLDTKIMKSLSEDARKSTTQIAKEAKTSRPTTIARIKRLSENQIMDFGAKINISKIGLKLASIHFQTDEPTVLISNKLKTCPRVLQLIQLTGKPNYTALIYIEDAETLMSSIECLESLLGAKAISYQRIVPLIGESFNLKILTEKLDKTPCGKECGVCLNYQQNECTGCPSTKAYKGPI